MGSSGAEQKSHADTEYYGLFPTILFMCHDYSPMHFVLSLENTPFECISPAIRILRHCGADVTMDIIEATAHSVVFTDHNNIVNFNGPTFEYIFIRNCLAALKLLDIAPFMRENSKEIIEGDKTQLCMEVFYFKRKTWSDIMKKSQSLCGFPTSTQIDNGFEGAGDKLGSDSNAEMPTTEKEPNAATRKNKRSTTKSSENNVNSSDVDDEEFDTFSKQGFATSTQIGNGCIGDKLGSDSDAEMPTTAKQSNAATRKNKRTFPYGLLSDNSGAETFLSETSSPSKDKSTSNRRTQTIVGTLQENKTLGGGCFLNNKEGLRGTEPQGLDEVSLSSTCQHSKKKSAPRAKQKRMELQENKPTSTLLEREAHSHTSSISSRKHTRLPYDFDERVKILKYIVDNNAFNKLKGNEIWKIMERKKVLPSRTWQSMKEHFIKKIVVDLEPYDFLTKSDKGKLAS